MGLFHLIGVLIGAIIVFATKIFWITTCYITSEYFETLNVEICHNFENIIFWFGIIIISFSVLGFILKMFKSK
ncbi:MAG: hypothetical protein ACLFPJ_02135 [Candidatus Woesearchaeota archaeon]